MPGDVACMWHGKHQRLDEVGEERTERPRVAEVVWHGE